MEKYLESYLDCLRIKNLAPKTISTFKMHLKLFLSYCRKRGFEKPHDITIEDLREYAKHLKGLPGKGGKSLSTNTIHLKLRVIKVFFTFLEKRQFIFFSPAERLELPTLGERLPAQILKEDEIIRMLAIPNVSTVIGLRDRAILELLYSSALRRAECIDLTIHDLDFGNGLVYVKMGKGRKGRMVPLGKKAIFYLKLYLKKSRPALTSDPDCKALFIGQGRIPLEGEGLNVIVKKYAQSADINKKISVHSFRKSAVTHMLKKDAHPLYLQRFLGHSTGETMRKYVKVTAKDIKKTHKKSHPSEKKSYVRVS